MLRQLFSLMLMMVAVNQAISQVATDTAARPGADFIAERLVDLAMKNPQISSSDNLAEQFKYSYRRTRSQWLDNIVLTGNLNEFSINQSGAAADPLKQSTQYPRYNVGVRLPVGMFINNGKEAKSMMHKYKSTQDDAQALRQAIRRQVLTVYEDYKMNTELTALQHEVLQDAKFLFAKTEEKFQKGEITLDVYTTANRLYNSEKVKAVALEHDLNVSIAQLEELIGMNLAVALKNITSPAQPTVLPK